MASVCEYSPFPLCGWELCLCVVCGLGLWSVWAVLLSCCPVRRRVLSSEVSSASIISVVRWSRSSASWLLSLFVSVRSCFCSLGCARTVM